MGLKDYIQGDRRGKEANRLEREAMSDPFLQDAMDGFDAVSGNHAQIIEQLEKKYTGVTIVETGHAPSLRRTRMFYWSIAASVLILIGISVYFFLDNPEKTTPAIAMLQSDESREEIIIEDGSTAPLIFDSTLSAASQPDRSSRKDLSGSIDLTVSKQAKAQELTVRSIDEVMDVSVDNEIVADEITADAIVTEEIVVEERLINNFVASPTKVVAKKEQDTQTIHEKAEVDEVVVVGYGTQKRSAVTGAAPSASKSAAAPRSFGEKEFQDYCQQNGDKNICAEKGASVRVTFFIDETGKPTKIEFRNYSCEDAKKEMENLLSSSPAWTKTNRKVTMTIKW